MRSLQSRQFPAHAGDTGTDQGLVTDKFEGQADQDRREGREPWSLHRIPDGRVAILRRMFQESVRLIAETAAEASARAPLACYGVPRGSDWLVDNGGGT